jgi:hypothetical protein
MTEKNEVQQSGDGHPFLADRRIMTKDQNLLERSGFAESPAEAIKSPFLSPMSSMVLVALRNPATALRKRVAGAKRSYLIRLKQ